MKLLRDVEVASMLAISRPMVWKLCRVDPSFPKGIAITAKATRWVEGEIINWLTSQKEADHGSTGTAESETGADNSNV